MPLFVNQENVYEIYFEGTVLNFIGVARVSESYQNVAMKTFEKNLLLQYKIFPKALNKNNAVSRPPMAVTFSLSSLLSAFP